MQFKRLTTYFICFSLALTIVYTTFSMPTDPTLDVSTTTNTVKIAQPEHYANGSSTGGGLISQTTLDALMMGAEVIVSSIFMLVKLVAVLFLPILFTAEYYGGTPAYALILPWLAAWQVLSGLALFWILIQVKLKMGIKTMD